MSLLIMAYTKDRETEMAIRNANKEDKEYAKKLAAAKAKLAAAKAAKATPQGSVKVVPPTSNGARNIQNKFEKIKLENAKSGAAAFFGKKGVEGYIKENKALGEKTKVVKVNSATPKRQGTTPASTPRRAGGLMGGGGAGNWRNMFK